ncbi:glycoside hydrolase family 43 protein [Ganoderma leucocontextum]|nr:glycoside hydrolase family 43 protein [Ganoderma leucocontextum]
MEYQQHVHQQNTTTAAADPYVRWDQKTSAYCQAYSTQGADPGWNFAIYTSPDLATWSKIPGGTIKNDSANVWAQDWWWAPECYHNEKTGWYFLFHAGRDLKPTKVGSGVLQSPDFEEASMIGVAVSRSPSGSFPPYLVPPSSHEEGETVPKGTYIPSNDPNNAYRNWVWSDEFDKYTEESNIYIVRLDDAWWHDPHAKTLPAVHKSFRDVHKNEPKDCKTSINSSFPGPARMARSRSSRTSFSLRFGKTHMLDHDQALRLQRYYLTYSANNYESRDYGIGYAVADKVSGPYYKSGSNPVLSQDASRSIYSTGHGSIVASGADSADPHHVRPSSSTARNLYTTRLFVEPSLLYLGFGPEAGDLRFPLGVAPLSIKAEAAASGNGSYEVVVRNASGAKFDLSNPINRVRVKVGGGGSALVNLDKSGAKAKGQTTVRFVYERARSNATLPWTPVSQVRGIGEGDVVNLTISV